MRLFADLRRESYLKKKKDEITICSSAAEYLTYFAYVGDQKDSIEIRYEDENILLTQKMMATLYDVETNTINYHIKKIFIDSELQEKSVIRKFRITASDGKSYSTNHYSLEMIIAVGFKVNSERAAAEKPHMGLTTYFNKPRLPRCQKRRRGALVFASINFETELKNHGNVVLQIGDELHQLWRCNRYKIFCIGLRSFVGIVIQFVGEFQYRIGSCFQFTKRSRESKRIFIILSWKLYNTRCVFG